MITQKCTNPDAGMSDVEKWILILINLLDIEGFLNRCIVSQARLSTDEEPIKGREHSGAQTQPKSTHGGIARITPSSVARAKNGRQSSFLVARSPWIRAVLTYPSVSTLKCTRPFLGVLTYIVESDEIFVRTTTASNWILGLDSETTCYLGITQISGVENKIIRKIFKQKIYMNSEVIIYIFHQVLIIIIKSRRVRWGRNIARMV